MDLRGIDGIAQVMALAVGNEGDQILGLAEFLDDQFYDIDVGHLIVTAHIIYLADSSLVDDQINGLACS